MYFPDLVMIIKWFTNIASRSPILEQVHLTQITPYNAKKITDNKKNYILDTLSIENFQQANTHATVPLTINVEHLWAFMHHDEVG